MESDLVLDSLGTGCVPSPLVLPMLYVCTCTGMLGPDGKGNSWRVQNRVHFTLFVIQRGAETAQGPTVREKQSLSKPSPLALRPALHSVLSVTHVNNFFNVGTFPKSYTIREGVLYLLISLVVDAPARCQVLF